MRVALVLLAVVMAACADIVGIDTITAPKTVIASIDDAAVGGGAGVVEAGAFDGPATPSSSNQPDAGAAADADADANVTKLVFVTEAEMNGDLGGLQDADTRCRDAASAAGLTAPQWRAWLTVQGQSAITRIDFTGAYRLPPPANTLVVSSRDELVANTLEAPINATEKGVAPTNTNNLRVWTGSATANCAGFTTSSAISAGETGALDQANVNWINDPQLPLDCLSTARLYCFEL